MCEKHQKLSAVDVVYASRAGLKFEICHNCNGVEIEGSMESSNFHHAKEGDIACKACEKTRLKKAEAKQRKVEKKKNQKLLGDAKLKEIQELEKEYGIQFIAFMDWKEMTEEEIKFDTVVMESNGYNLFLSGDGATVILISKEEVDNHVVDTYIDLLEELEEITKKSRYHHGKNEYKVALSRTLGILHE